MSHELEKDILQKCLLGEFKAQRALYDHFSGTMYAVCLRYSNNREDAKDILQDGFIKVYNKLAQFSGKGSLEGWMKRVFINTALEHYRVNKIYMEQSDIEYAIPQAQEDFIIEKISRKEILDIFGKLAPGYRSVLNLYAIEGYSHAEISEMLGISEGTSKSQLSRARLAFAEEMRKLKVNKTHSIA